MEGGKVVLLYEVKVQMMAYEAQSLDEILPNLKVDAFLTFEEVVAGTAAMKLEEVIHRESGGYALLPFEHQALVGAVVLSFELETQKVGCMFLPLEKENDLVAEVLAFELEIQEVGYVFLPY